MNIIYLLGLITLAFIIFLVFSILIVFITGYLLIKRNKLIFPKLAIYLLDNFYPIIFKFFSWLDAENLFYLIGVELYNKFYFEKFKNARKKLLILPHCLRNNKCPAKLNNNGLICVKCKKCVIGEILEVSEKLNFKVYIVPGSTFLKRILLKERADAVFGVACSRDLFFGMNMLSRKGIAPQGLALLKDGCFETVIDKNELIYKLERLK
ncbi:DUF116 domain-containing protein [Methanocaldococcus infernus]